jgi:hypothetical protein
MKHNDAFEYSEPRGPLRRFGLPIGLGLIAIVAIVMLIKMLASAGGGLPARHEDIVTIRPVPPPQQPTPPPVQQPQQQVQKQEMMDQAPIADEEPKPADTPHDEPPAALGTNITGSGGPDYGLAHGGNGGMIGGGGGNGSGRGEGPYAAYGRKLQRSIVEALQKDPRTRSASFNLTNLRLFPDDFGRIAKVNLGSSTGDPTRDEAIREILKSLQLPEPPAGIPKPIHLRVVVRRPNG